MEYTLTDLKSFDISIKKIINAVKELLPISQDNIKLIGEKIEQIYDKHKENPQFKDAFESLLIELMEMEGEETIKIFFSLLPIKQQIKNQIIEDLKEAQKTLEIKKALQQNKNIDEIFSNL